MKKILFSLLLIAGAFYGEANTILETSEPTALSPVTQKITTNINGYLQHLPENYDNEPNNRFPLIISLGSSEEIGNGTAQDLQKLEDAYGSIGYMIKSGDFPTSVELDGKSFSFIVICPQFNVASPENVHLQLNKFINHIKRKLRVDTRRVYVTGFDLGAENLYSYIAGINTAQGFANIVTAAALINPAIENLDKSLGLTRVTASNLPMLVSNAQDFPSIGTDFVNFYNQQSPTPSPLVKKATVSKNVENIRFATFDPTTVVDTVNNYNIYQWMLQYTNQKLKANAGKNQYISRTSTVLDASSSVARSGRIKSYSWKQITGMVANMESSRSATLDLSNLVNGLYAFEVEVTHSNNSIDRDTVQVEVTGLVSQSINKISQKISNNINGYVISLPSSYEATPTKNFPLIVMLHGQGDIGNGSYEALDSLTKYGPLLHIKNGTFPAFFNVGEFSESFIVVSPQFNVEGVDDIHNQLNAFITEIKNSQRVDNERVYVTGTSFGGGLTYAYATGSQASMGFADDAAAIVMACPYIRPVSYIPTTIRNRLVDSNLPMLFTHNSGDFVVPIGNSILSVSYHNAFSPSTPAKLITFPVFGHDAWTKTYDPLFIADSENGYNIYQWMLQYTNSKLVANAGKDQTISGSSVYLDGSRSQVRGGRIDSYTWSKISGPEATISNSNAATTSVTGLAKGIYQFRLEVTHSEVASLSERDTVQITVE